MAAVVKYSVTVLLMWWPKRYVGGWWYQLLVYISCCVVTVFNKLMQHVHHRTPGSLVLCGLHCSTYLLGCAECSRQCLVLSRSDMLQCAAAAGTRSVTGSWRSTSSASSGARCQPTPHQ
jgi:hypothetical protein